MGGEMGKRLCGMRVEGVVGKFMRKDWWFVCLK